MRRGWRSRWHWSAGKPGVEDQLLGLEADTAAYSGRLRDAREFSRRAMDSAERAQEKEPAATYSALSGLREALFGNAEEARRRAALAMGLSAGRDVQYGAALAFVYAGDDARAQALADDLGKRFPEDTIVQFNFLPTLRAKLAVSKGNASEAIESLRTAAPYELGQTTSSTYGWTALYPVYVRGEAYLAAHQGNEAAAEFQKILDHRGVVLNETHRSTRTSPNRQSLRHARRHRQSQGGLSGFPHALERCRPGHSRFHCCESGIREVEVSCSALGSGSGCTLPQRYHVGEFGLLRIQLKQCG